MIHAATLSNFSFLTSDNPTSDNLAISTRNASLNTSHRILILKQKPLNITV